MGGSFMGTRNSKLIEKYVWAYAALFFEGGTKSWSSVARLGCCFCKGGIQKPGFLERVILVLAEGGWSIVCCMMEKMD